MTPLIRLVAGLAVGLLCAPVARADVQKLAADGTVHRIDVETVSTGKTIGSALRHTKQKPKGGRESALVPGTEDLSLDRDPALEIDPASGRLVLVWARFEGTGFNLFVSRYEGTYWSAPRALYRGDGDDLEPQIRVGGGYVHVSFRQELSGQTSFYRVSLWSSTLNLAYGPERVPTNETWSIPPEGDAGPGTLEPPPCDRFFCGVTFSKNTGDPGHAFLWGVRDEPVPISYREVFLVPPEVRSACAAEAGWVGGRFTFWFVSGDKLYYWTRRGSAWSEMRVVEFVPGTLAADARWLVLQANAR